MRTVSPQSTEDQNLEQPQLGSNFETFSATLSNGRVITIREMTGRDLLYLEDELSEYKETRRSFHILERLNVGPNKISFDDVADLPYKDIKLLMELVSKVSDLGEDGKGEDPKSE